MKNQLWQKIYLLFMMNICVCITTLPLITTVTFFKPTMLSLVVYFIASLPLGPSFFSLYYCLRCREHRENITLFKSYFSFFTSHFMASLFYTVVLQSLLFIGIILIFFISTVNHNTWLNPVIVLLLFISIMIYTQLFNLFSDSLREEKRGIVVKKALEQVFVKCYFSVFNACLMITLILLFILRPVLTFLLLPSLLFSLIVWNHQ